jgi:PAS domain S-box-containing protein
MSVGTDQHDFSLISRTMRFRTGLARTLLKFDEDPPVFREAFDLFAAVVASDVAFFHRRDEQGASTFEAYAAAAIAPEVAEQRRSVIERAIPKAAQPGKTLRASRDGKMLVASIGTDGPRHLVMVFLRLAVPFKPADRWTIANGLELAEPLLEARSEYNLREVVRHKAERELRANETELKSLFENSRDMVYTVNAEDRIASINPAGLTLLGLANRFDAVGHLFSEFVFNIEDREYFRTRIAEFGFVKDYEIIVKNPVGDPKFCIETAHAIRHADGSVAEVQGIVKDISDRIANENALWKVNIELAETNARLQETQIALVQREKLASIGQLAAGVAHEINNPLGFLKSNHQSLKRYFTAFQRAWEAAAPALPIEQKKEIVETQDLAFAAEELPHLFAESDDGFARIVEIVSQLKSFSRVDSEPHRSPYDLEHGLESTLVVAWNEIKYVAEVERNYGGVRSVEAEGGPINQVLLNILVNAAQAIASQGRKEKGKITITTREEPPYVICEIEDDGPGMTAEVKERIFDPFFTTKGAEKGSGLGLSISNDIIVVKHRGRLSVRSEPGKGAVFTIALPMDAPVRPEEASPGGRNPEDSAP